MKQLTAIDASALILTYFDNKGDLISNKKLQKLLYYVEAWSLVHTESFIKEDFQAWVHGPVVPESYHRYKVFMYSPIVSSYAPEETSGKRLENIFKTIGEKQKSLVEDVLTRYGALNSFQLEMLSHSEYPWKSARGNISPFVHSTEVIKKDVMKAFYSSLL